MSLKKRDPVGKSNPTGNSTKVWKVKTESKYTSHHKPKLVTTTRLLDRSALQDCKPCGSVTHTHTHTVSRTQLGSVARRPVTTEALNPSHVCTLQTLSLASGPRPVFPLRLTLAVEKGLHGDRLKTTKRSTHRTESHSMSRLTSGGQPHASHLDGVAPTPR